MLCLREKAKFLDLIKMKLFAEVANICGKNESSIREIVKRKKQFVLVLLLCLKLQNFLPQCGIGAQLNGKSIKLAQ